MKEQRMYIIKLDNKRFNNKKFTSYDEARNYARKTITKRVGKYFDNIGDFGFAVIAK